MPLLVAFADQASSRRMRHCHHAKGRKLLIAVLPPVRSFLPWQAAPTRRTMPNEESSTVPRRPYPPSLTPSTLNTLLTLLKLPSFMFPSQVTTIRFSGLLDSPSFHLDFFFAFPNNFCPDKQPRFTLDTTADTTATLPSPRISRMCPIGRISFGSPLDSMPSP